MLSCDTGTPSTAAVCETIRSSPNIVVWHAVVPNTTRPVSSTLIPVHRTRVDSFIKFSSRYVVVICNHLSCGPSNNAPPSLPHQCFVSNHRIELRVDDRHRLIPVQHVGQDDFRPPRVAV